MVETGDRLGQIQVLAGLAKTLTQMTPHACTCECQVSVTVAIGGAIRCENFELLTNNIKKLEHKDRTYKYPEGTLQVTDFNQK